MTPEMITIKCRDCETTVSGKFAQPKMLAKYHGWKHAGKGVWRCKDCEEVSREQELQQTMAGTGKSQMARTDSR